MYAIAVTEILTNQPALPNVPSDSHPMQMVSVVLHHITGSTFVTHSTKKHRVVPVMRTLTSTLHAILHFLIRRHLLSTVLLKVLILETLSVEEISLLDHGSFQAVVNSRIKDTTKTCTLLSSVWKLKFGTATPHGNTLLPLVI